MDLVKMTLPITTKEKETITNMKFDEIADKIIKEGEYGGWEPEDEKEAALDKKEAYKDNLMRRGEDEEEIDPLEDPKFQEALDILEDLQARSPDKFEKFVTRLMDLVDYKKGVSL